MLNEIPNQPVRGSDELELVWDFSCELCNDRGTSNYSCSRSSGARSLLAGTCSGPCRQDSRLSVAESVHRCLSVSRSCSPRRDRCGFRRYRTRRWGSLSSLSLSLRRLRRSGNNRRCSLLPSNGSRKGGGGCNNGRTIRVILYARILDLIMFGENSELSARRVAAGCQQEDKGRSEMIEF